MPSDGPLIACRYAALYREGAVAKAFYVLTAGKLEERQVAAGLGEDVGIPPPPGPRILQVSEALHMTLRLHASAHNGAPLCPHASSRRSARGASVARWCVLVARAVNMSSSGLKYVSKHGRSWLSDGLMMMAF